MSETLCASTQPLGGWVRISYTFTASSTKQVFKITSSAANASGDDFQMTQVNVVACRPILNISSNSPLCVGQTLQLTASTPATGTFTYTWTGPNGFSSNLQNPDITSVTTANAGVYTCIITDGTGQTNTKTITVGVNSLPILGGANSSCVGSTNTVTPKTGGTWTSSNTAIATITNDGEIIGKSAGTVTLTFTDGTTGCTNTKSFIVTICPCYKSSVNSGTILDTNHGITALGRAGADNGNWPMVRKGAWTALEAKTKGFVVNRITTTASVEAIPNPIEGMMVYDEEADCLKINTDGTTTGWKCFNTQTCPD